MVLAARGGAMEDVAGDVACRIPKGKNSKRDSNFYALLSLLLRTYYAELSAIAKNDVWGGSRSSFPAAVNKNTGLDVTQGRCF